MGEIFLAVLKRQDEFEKVLVIKRILPSLSQNPEFVAMFNREARIAALLNHQNVVQVYDYGREGDEYFIAMEHVDGTDLRSLLTELGPPPPPVAIAILSGVARGLDYAHRLRDRKGKSLSLVHRDVSPGNVLVSREGEVKLTDFGLVASDRAEFETDGGMMKGKYAYMSPEQTYADPLDARSDLFSLGILAYELLTGERPFKGGVVELVAGIRKVHYPPLDRPEMPPKLLELVSHCLQLHADERPESAARVLSELDALASEAGWRDTLSQLTEWVEPACASRPTYQSHSGPAATAVGDAPIRQANNKTSDERRPEPTPVKGRPLLALAVLFLLLAAAGAYALVGRGGEGEGAGEAAGSGVSAPPEATLLSVEVVTRPPGAELLVDSAVVGSAPHLLTELAAGEPVLVTTRLAGYEPQRRTFRPEDLPATDDPAVRTLELTHLPLPGAIALSSEPNGLPVLLDGEPVGETPLELRRDAPATHTISVAAPGFRGQTQTLQINPGERSTLHFVLERLVRIRLAGEPAGAIAVARREGDELGRCELPCELELTPGSLELEATLDGYTAQTRLTDVSEDGDVNFELAPETRYLLAEWRAHGDASIDRGRERIRAPNSESRVSYTVAGGAAQGTVSARYSPSPDNASVDVRLTIGISPGWARVRFAGEGASETPCEIEARGLEPGSHTLEIQPSGTGPTHRLTLRVRDLRE